MQITSDRVVVMNHDLVPSDECVFAGEGAAPPTRTIAALLASEVALFDCHPGVPGIDAPRRLEAVLDLHTRGNIGFDLEFKDTASTDAGVRVATWTPNDATRMCELIALGVDGIISDDPALLARTARDCR